ncbi:MAG: DEAD/DEAH box helicase [Spirochaetaceae bacterium]|nr:DEAD/DEAH box helicase [Spirochaetaceae bacterium]
MSTFIDLKVRKSLNDALAKKEITSPTDVQTQIIPAVLEGKNIIFSSETGTGKTYAFLLPLMTKLLNERENQIAEKIQPTPQPRILVVAPTHELASQIKQEADFLAKAEGDEADERLKLKTMLCIGGASITRQIDALKAKPQIIAGGPARLLELIHLKKLKTQQVFAVVLDEVDRLLSPELRDITVDLIKAIDSSFQLIACSATIKQSQLKILEDASGKKLENVMMPKEDVLKRNISHYALHAERRDKIDTLRSLIVAEKPERVLVFSAETGQIANIVEKLRYKKIDCTGLHAKTDKMDRKKAIDDFRSGKCKILVTSDLAARGLDIGNITHIIQMDVPSNEDFFVHRAGRTARAGKTGINIVIGDEYELRQLAKLEKKLGIIIYPKVLYGGKLMAPPQE